MWFKNQILSSNSDNEPSDLLCRLEENAKKFCCGKYLNHLRSIDLHSLYQDLQTERQQRKYGDLLLMYRECGEDWNKLLLIAIMQHIGDTNNRARYTEIALRLPSIAVQQERTSLRATEILLLACSGLLDILPRDKFCDIARREGQYLKHKYQITSLEHRDWDRRAFMPTKHPITRLLQVARLLFEHKMLFNKVLECKNRNDIINIFNVEHSTEWCHYLGIKDSVHLGISKCDIIGINVVVQILSAFGTYTANEELIYAASDLIESLPAESNSIITRWKKQGLTPTTAYETQALIQLHNEYCKKKKCEKCPVYKHMTSKASVIHEVSIF